MTATANAAAQMPAYREISRRLAANEFHFCYDVSLAGRVSTSTVVHIHNLLGRGCMLFVACVHRLIVAAMLSRAAR